MLAEVVDRLDDDLVERLDDFPEPLEAELRDAAERLREAEDDRPELEDDLRELEALRDEPDFFPAPPPLLLLV